MPERVVKVRLTAQIAEYRTAMEEAANKTRAVGTESERLAQKREAFQQLGGALVGVGAAMTALTIAVAKTGIEYNTLQQTSRAALTTLLGSAEAANAQMDKLDAFARTSPFAKTTFITAQQQMLAFGIESKKVIPYLDAIQDAVAAAGGSNQELGEIAFIMAQISSAGKITAQDLLQFGQRGVNAAELIGSQMGKTGAQIRDEITAGTLDADDALDALADGMKARFDGAAANVKNTFAGALDRVKAAWRDLSSDLMTPLVDPSGGGALVDIINWAADMLRAVQALPDPIKLTGGALFALAGVLALVSGTVLAATPRIAAMKIAFMELSATMRGFAIVGGGAMIALTALLAVVGAVAASQAAAQARAESYADTLEEGTRKVTDATRELIATNLTADQSFLWISQGSLADNAETLGLSISTVTDAISGNADALDEVNAAIQRGLAEGYKPMKDANLQLNDAAVLLQAGLEDQIGSLDKAAEIARQQSEATEESAEVAANAGQAYLDEAATVDELNSKLTDLIDKINEANGVGQNAVTANSRWQSSLAGISEEVQRQKDAYEEANGTLDGFSLSLDQSTVSGAANAAGLADVAANAQAAAEAQFQQDQATMSAKESADKYLATLSAQRQAFIDSAIGAGYNADQVYALADQIFKMPTEKEFQAIVETANAQSKLDQFVTLNNGRRVKVFVDAEGGQSFKVGSTTVSANAAGGFYKNKVKEFAGGGFEPGIYPYTAGGIHKMAEEYAEAYISLDPARRARSEAVWVRTGQELGMFAGGPSSAPQLPPIYIQSPVTGEYLLARTSEIADARASARGSSVAGSVRRRRWDDA